MVKERRQDGYKSQPATGNGRPVTVPELIYCAAGNPRFAKIAIDAGYSYGAQLPGHVPYPPAFADQDWKRPDRERYMTALAEQRPRMATVLDLERYEQLEEVLDWAEEAAEWVSEAMIIIPKAFGIIGHLPRSIGGVSIRLGYSVPTKYGGTQLPIWEFSGWPVHLLGGSPHAQMRLAHYFQVASADGNMAQKTALQFGKFWQDGRWVRLDSTGDFIADDAPYEAFRRSCANIMAAWSCKR